MTGDPLVFNKVAYYTTYLADTDDACAIGTGRIYGVNYKQASGMTPLAGLDADGDPTTIGNVSFVSTGESVPYGVQIIQRPTCQPSDSDSADALGQKASNANGLAQGDLELAVNVAKGTDFGSNTVPPNANGADLPTKTITRALSESGEMIQGGTWGYVLY